MKRIATKLTAEERDVLILSGRLLTNEEIAACLNMSIIKVKTLIHRASVKLGVHTRHAATFSAIVRGYIRLDEIIPPDELIERLEGSVSLSKIAQFVCQRADNGLLPMIDRGVLYADNKRDTILTTREREVIALVGRGLTNREIAEKLFISFDTVRNALNKACSKLGARSRGEACVLALKKREIEISEVMPLDGILQDVSRWKPESLKKMAQLLRMKLEQKPLGIAG